MYIHHQYVHMTNKNVTKIATTTFFLSFIVLTFGSMFVGAFDPDAPMVVRLGLFFMTGSSIVIISTLLLHKYNSPKDPYEDIDI